MKDDLLQYTAWWMTMLFCIGSILWALNGARYNDDWKQAAMSRERFVFKDASPIRKNSIWLVLNYSGKYLVNDIIVVVPGSYITEIQIPGTSKKPLSTIYQTIQ